MSRLDRQTWRCGQGKGTSVRPSCEAASFPKHHALKTPVRGELAPKDGKRTEVPSFQTAAEYVAALDKAAAEARAALKDASEAHLVKNWQLLVAGNVVQQASRFDMISDTLAHWVHHRGQMTVYLRLMGATVPALYGPSADDKSF